MKASIAQLYLISIACLLSACANHNNQPQGTGLSPDKEAVYLNTAPQALPGTDTTQSDIVKLPPPTPSTVAATAQTATTDTIAGNAVNQQPGQTAEPLPTIAHKRVLITQPDYKTMPGVPAPFNPYFIEQKIGFVAFEVGKYQRPPKTNTDIIVTQLQTLPKDARIILTGHSHSRKQLASDHLAQIRATTLKDILVSKGINSQRILVQTDAVNQRQQGKLLHGVTVYALLEVPKPLAKEDLELALEDKPLPTTQPSTETTDTNSQLDKHIPLPSAPTLAPVATTQDTTLPACGKVTFQPGSLRANIERAINHCGYVMGRWVFGTGNTLQDWDVPLGFHTQIEQELPGLLTFIEHNYHIRAHVHKLDSSIDFLPSINQASQVPDHEDD